MTHGLASVVEMPEPLSSDPTIHLVEVGGRGGVYHHTLAVGRALEADGQRVVVHTAEDAEMLDDGLEKCACMRWSRSLPTGPRQGWTASRFLTQTVPHLVRTVQPADIVHVQGVFGNQLTAWMIDRLVRAHHRVAYSPHNTFARSRRRIDERTIEWMSRRAAVVITFSDDDRRRVLRWGANPIVADLVHHIPTPTEEERADWHQRFSTRPVALLAGQVRADKRPDVFVDACRRSGVTPAIVGPALDGEHLVAGDVRRGDVIRVDGYLPLSSFVAAVAEADVVVATHAVGSVSGPLSFAVELGVRSVAPQIGGLAEAVTVAAADSTAQGFAGAIQAALDLPAPAPRTYERVAADHLAAYRLTGWIPG